MSLRFFSFPVSALCLTLTLTHAAPESTAAQLGARTTEAAVAADQRSKPLIQALLSITNVVIFQDALYIGRILDSDILVSALVVSRQDSSEKLKGLRIDRGNGFGNLLDIDEAAGLSRALATMIDLSSRINPEERRTTEVSFKTSGNFAIQMQTDPLGQRVSLQIPGRVELRIKVTDLPKIKDLIDESLKVLSTR